MSAIFNPSAPTGLTAGIDPNDVEAVFTAIEIRDGRLTPEAVVAEAKSMSSPLHSFFEWNDSKAAHAYRLKQARTLIGWLMVQPVATAKPVTLIVTPVRAFPHIPGTTRSGGGYASQAVVAANPGLAVRVVEEYDRQLRTLFARNVAYESALKASKVAPVVKAIEAYLKANPKP